MRVLYSMAHPSDRIDDERAGHVVRPRLLLQALTSLGHDVEVCEAAANSTAQFAASSYWRIRSVLPGRMTRAARDAARVVQNDRFSRRLLEVAQRFEPDLILETQVAFSTAGARVAQRTGIPLLLDDVSPAAEDLDTYDVVLAYVAGRRRRESLSAARAITVSSPAIRAELLAEGASTEKVSVLPNGSAVTPRPEQEAALLRRSLQVEDDVVLVAYVGSFQSFHRVDLLIEALARLEDESTIALLVGDGDRRSDVQALARRLGVADRCRFVGRVPSSEIALHLQAADVAVLPSTADYTNPMKLYDYLAAGIPVVAPRQAAVVEVLGDADVALFEPGSVADLTDKLRVLVGTSEARSTSSARSFANVELHTWAARARQLLEIVDDALTAPSR